MCLITPADYEFFNEGVEERAELRSAYDEKVAAHDQLLADSNCATNVKEGMNKRIEELEREKKEWLKFGEEQVSRIKKLEVDLAELEKEAHQLRNEKEDFVVKCGQGEMVRQRLIHEYLPTFVRRLLQGVEYKGSLEETFSLPSATRWIKGISIGRLKA
ncbi:hypothetical protein Tco_1027185 [Tanacetum coccineum]